MAARTVWSTIWSTQIKSTLFNFNDESEETIAKLLKCQWAIWDRTSDNLLVREVLYR